MAENYDITYETESVGTAKVEKQGLYYSFSCRCSLPEEGLYRIHAICDAAREDLGICVPMDGLFGMDKKLPAKRLGEGPMRFELVHKDWSPQEITAVQEPELPQQEEESLFIPVSEEEPFEYLDKLEDAVMEVREDEIGVVLQQK